MFEAPQRDAGSRDLAEATRRLERALVRLEAELTAKTLAPAKQEVAKATELAAETDRLKSELTTAWDRVRALEETAASASEALGRAVLEVRAALGNDEERGDAQDEAPAEAMESELGEEAS